MLSVVLVLAGACLAHGEYNARCAEKPHEGVQLQPSMDGVPARYLLEYCKQVEPLAEEWVTIVNVYDRLGRDRCTEKWTQRTHHKKHSHSEELLDSNWKSFNCTHVCFTIKMDMMYSSCYMVLNNLKPGTKGTDNTIYYVDNNITAQYYTNTSTSYKDFSNDQEMVIQMYLGHVPVTNYTVEICPGTINNNCSDVTKYCVRDGISEVRCELAQPHDKNETLYLQHQAPWKNGLFYQLGLVNFRLVALTSPAPIAAARGNAAVWWGAAAALAAAAAILAAFAARDSCLFGALKASVERYCRESQGVGELEEVPSVPPSPRPGRVVLVYARDCAPAGRLVEALTALIEEVAPDTVVDLHSPEMMSNSGGAALATARTVLADPDSTVLVLQTPAMVALHRPALDAHAPLNEPTLAVPLLGRGVVYRSPQPSDNVAADVLRLLDETAHIPGQTSSYRKYYIATVTGVEAESLSAINPFRRYELPGAAAELVADITGPNPSWATPRGDPNTPLDPSLAALWAATRDLADYVRNNPDYLADLFYV